MSIRSALKEATAVRAKSSRTGSSYNVAGYTLVELLVVLAVIALFVAFVPAAISAGHPSTQLRKFAQSLSDDLRELRGLALSTNQETYFVLDLEHRRYVLLPNRAEKPLPHDLLVKFQSSHLGIDTDATEIRFYPDGTSSGGELDLSLGRAHRLLIASWLTGRVAVDE
jgi:general secretion pathway protein H